MVFKTIQTDLSDLYKDVQELPTIRKIDLVDMEQVDKRFKTMVMANPIFFLNQKQGVSEQLPHVYKESYAKALCEELDEYFAAFKELEESINAWS
jgi:hypothetical protein